MGAPVREVVDTQLHFGTQMPFGVGASIPLVSGEQIDSGIASWQPIAAPETRSLKAAIRTRYRSRADGRCLQSNRSLTPLNVADRVNITNIIVGHLHPPIRSIRKGR